MVACATSGDLFCRECAISDLLAQRQEIKRVERERGEARRRIEAGEERTAEEARGKEVREFELASMGLDPGNGGNNRKRKVEGDELGGVKAREVEVDGKRKRVFELDEKEMARVSKEEQERLKEELKQEKVIPIHPLSILYECILTGYSPNRPNQPYPHSGSHLSHRARIQTK